MWSCAPSQEPHIDDCCPLAAVIMDTQLNRPPHKMHTLLMSRQKYQYYASTRQVLMKDRGNFSHARGPRYATAIVGLLGLLNTNMKKMFIEDWFNPAAPLLLSCFYFHVRHLRSRCRLHLNSQSPSGSLYHRSTDHQRRFCPPILWSEQARKYQTQG